MTPIGEGRISLTKHYQLGELVSELAQITPGMTVDDARQVLAAGGHAHAELADDLFIFKDGEIVDDTLLEACRNQAAEARLLVWAALLLADSRLAQVVEDFLTSPDGKIDASEFSAERLRGALAQIISTESGKVASNILRYFETAEIVDPAKHGGTIVGVGSELSTAHAVPALVRYLQERLKALDLHLGPAADATDLALAPAPTTGST